MIHRTPIRLTEDFSRRLFLSTTFAMFLAALFSLVITVSEFNAGLRPFLEQKARSVAVAVQRDIEYALQIGIPLDEVRGIDAHIQDLISDHPEVKALQVIAFDNSQQRSMGDVQVDIHNELDGFDLSADVVISKIHAVASTVLGQPSGSAAVYADIMYEGVTVARVKATVDETYLNSKMTSIFFDTLIILIAVSLVALEIAVVVATTQLTEPFRLVENAINKRAQGDLRQYQSLSGSHLVARFIQKLNDQNAHLRDAISAARQSLSDPDRLQALKCFGQRYFIYKQDVRRGASIIDARIPLFVFSFAEELQKSFLPLFVAEFHSNSDLFSRDIMMGLPISAFMFVIAVFTPFAGKLVDRFGNKTLFMTGLLPAVGGYLWCYFAHSANDILIGRSMTAIGYAVITISSQSYIAAVVPPENRARGMAIFVGVLMAATMCGTAVGAILADWLGYKPVFLIATLFSLLAGVLGLVMLRTDLPASESKKVSVARVFGTLRVII